MRRFVFFAGGVVVGAAAAVALAGKRVTPAETRAGDAGVFTTAEPGGNGSVHRVLVTRTSGGSQIPLPDDKPRRAWNLRIGDRHWAFVETPE